MIRTIALCWLVAFLTVGCDWKVSHTATATRAKPKATLRYSHEPGSDAFATTNANVDMPTNYVAAVERLREYANAIKDAIAAGTSTKANRPLYEAKIVIEEIMLIAHESRVPKCAWEEVHAARRSLHDSLDTLHAALDAGEQPDLSAVAPAIESSLQHLEAVAAKLY